MNPASDPAWRARAFEEIRQALQAGDLARARPLAIEVLGRGVEHPLLLNLRALDHEDNGRLALALADLRRAHILAPKDFSILNACGLCLARLGRLDEALECYVQATDIEPEFGPAWYNTGWALEQLGELPRAAEAYGKSVALNPQNAQGWANLAWLAARRGDAAAAKAHAERAFTLQPGHPTATLALASAEADQPRAAEQRLRELLSEPASERLRPRRRPRPAGRRP